MPIQPKKNSKGLVKPDWPYTINIKSPQSNGLVAWWPITNSELGDRVVEMIGYGGDLLFNTSLAGTVAPIWSTDTARVVDGTTLGGDIVLDNGGAASAAAELAVVPADYQNVLAGPGALAAWVLMGPQETGGGVIIGTEASANGTPAMSLETVAVTGGVGFQGRVSGASATKVAASTVPYMLGVWHHVLVSWNAVGSTAIITLYVDGVFITSTPFSTNVLPSQNTGPLTIFAGLTNTGTATSFFHGQIADLRIYNRYIATEEAASMFSPDTRWDVYRAQKAKSYGLPGPFAPNSLVTFPRKRSQNLIKPSWPFRINLKSPQANGLLAWWPMTNTELGDRASEMVGFNGDLQLFSGVASTAPPVWTSDTSLAADNTTLGGDIVLDGNGTTSMASLPTVPAEYETIMTGPGAIAAWVLLKPTVAANGTIIARKANGSSVVPLWLSVQTVTGGFSFSGQIGSGASVSTATGGNPVTIGYWHHVVFTWDLINATHAMHLFIDGKDSADTQIGFAGPATKQTGALTIFGGLSSAGAAANFLAGQIADLRLYNRLITQQEALDMFSPGTRWDLYQSTKGRSFTRGAIMAFPPPVIEAYRMPFYVKGLPFSQSPIAAFLGLSNNTAQDFTIQPETNVNFVAGKYVAPKSVFAALQSPLGNLTPEDTSYIQETNPTGIPTGFKASKSVFASLQTPLGNLFPEDTSFQDISITCIPTGFKAPKTPIAALQEPWGNLIPEDSSYVQETNVHFIVGFYTAPRIKAAPYQELTGNLTPEDSSYIQETNVTGTPAGFRAPITPKASFLGVWGDPNLIIPPQPETNVNFSVGTYIAPKSPQAIYQELQRNLSPEDTSYIQETNVHFVVGAFKAPKTPQATYQQTLRNLTPEDSSYIQETNVTGIPTGFRAPKTPIAIQMPWGNLIPEDSSYIQETNIHFVVGAFKAPKTPRATYRELLENITPEDTSFQDISITGIPAGFRASKTPIASLQRQLGNLTPEDSSYIQETNPTGTPAGFKPSRTVRASFLGIGSDALQIIPPQPETNVNFAVGLYKAPKTLPATYQTIFRNLSVEDISYVSETNVSGTPRGFRPTITPPAALLGLSENPDTAVVLIETNVSFIPRGFKALYTPPSVFLCSEIEVTDDTPCDCLLLEDGSGALLLEEDGTCLLLETSATPCDAGQAEPNFLLTGVKRRLTPAAAFVGLMQGSPSVIVVAIESIFGDEVFLPPAGSLF